MECTFQDGRKMMKTDTQTSPPPLTVCNRRGLTRLKALQIQAIHKDEHLLGRDPTNVSHEHAIQTRGQGAAKSNGLQASRKLDGLASEGE